MTVSCQSFTIIGRKENIEIVIQIWYQKRGESDTMPIFEYRCARCGGQFELLVRCAAAEVSCPDCRSSRVKKLFSAFAFKGSGGKSATSSCGGCAGRRCSSCR